MITKIYDMDTGGACGGNPEEKNKVTSDTEMAVNESGNQPEEMHSV